MQGKAGWLFRTAVRRKELSPSLGLRLTPVALRGGDDVAGDAIAGEIAQPQAVIGLGIAMGTSRYIDETVGSLVLGLQSLPSVTWFPLAVLWFGLNQVF